MATGGYLLRDIPKDVKDYLLEKQKCMRIKRGSMVSLEMVIYSIVREKKKADSNKEASIEV
jgi:hypothetical protein